MDSSNLISSVGESQRSKVMGSCFLHDDASCDATEDPKIAGLPLALKESIRHQGGTDA